MELVYFKFSGAAGGSFLFFFYILFPLSASPGYHSFLSILLFFSDSYFACLHLFEALFLVFSFLYYYHYYLAGFLLLSFF